MSVQPLRSLADALRSRGPRTNFKVSDAELVSALLWGMERRGEHHIEQSEARRLAAIFTDNPLSLFTSKQEIGLLAWVAARMCGEAAWVAAAGHRIASMHQGSHAANDRAALVHDVCVVLGLISIEGEHAGLDAARALCELAGWPS